MTDKHTLQSILNQGKTQLENGDIDGYWSLMSKHSNYAKLAGQVAKGDGVFAEVANERLQRKAQKHLGRKLSHKEMNDIRLNIAKADHATRGTNLKTEGHIGVTGQDTDTYHAKVFGEKKLPDDTYTAHHAQQIMGPI